MRDAVVIYFDGGSRGNPGPAAIGALVLDASTVPPERLATVSEPIGVTTNNSKLVIEQLAGRWKVKQPNLKPLHAEARALLDSYDEVDLAHVAREHNVEADALVNAALDLP